ncbi:N-acetyltransferase [Vibrio sp. T187]|uniref:GNAT family N-acetyltransferase n=1 Tax=Vibrio TaxID=662 RepID=UPI0010C95F87|nr:MULTISPECIES: GNAT family N-acetyltransferase [Vibrio]MBW3695099.1 N-acetyltransferase [Vibrio sp. T187]
MNLVNWNKELDQFSVHLEGEHYAIVKYKRQDKVLHITSTRVPDQVQGKGYGKVMMEAVLPIIEKEGFTIVPVCSYVVHFLNRSTQWSHLLADKGE